MIDSFTGEYRFLSIFWPAHVVYQGWIFPTVEHAYQAAKSNDPAVWARMANVVKPGEAKRYGREIIIRKDWDAVKIHIMTDLVRQKFSHPGLRHLLLKTGDQELIEGNHWNDRFWGVCRGGGRNELGKILM